MGRIIVNLWNDGDDTLTVELDPSAALRLRAQLDEALQIWALDNQHLIKAERGRRDAAGAICH